MTDTGSDDVGRRLRLERELRVARLLAVFAFGLVSLEALSYTSVLRLCRDELASVGSDPVARVCGPLMPPEWVAALVLLALIWPLVKRFNLGVLGAELERAAAGIDARARAFLTQTIEPKGIPSEEAVGTPTVSHWTGADLADASFRIRVFLEAINPHAWPPIARALEQPKLTDLQKLIVREWARTFDKEIGLVHQAAGSRDTLSADEIASAVKIANQILRVLTQRLEKGAES